VKKVNDLHGTGNALVPLLITGIADGETGVPARRRTRSGRPGPAIAAHSAIFAFPAKFGNVGNQRPVREFFKMCQLDSGEIILRRKKKSNSPDTGGVVILVTSVADEHFGSVGDRLGSSSLLGHWSPAGDANFALVALPGRSDSRAATQSDTGAVVMFAAGNAK
jgi:hypothetical protein